MRFLLLSFGYAAAALALAASGLASCSSDSSAPDAASCCPAGSTVCNIPMNDAGQCLACCKGDVCGLPPEADGGCEGPTLPEAGAPCTKNAECATEFVCGFALANGCTAQGVCMFPASCPAQPSTVCTCTGNVPSDCVAPGYMSAPSQVSGTCGGNADAGADAPAEAAPGPSDASSDAGSDASSDATPE